MAFQCIKCRDVINSSNISRLMQILIQQNGKVIELCTTSVGEPAAVNRIFLISRKEIWIANHIKLRLARKGSFNCLVVINRFFLETINNRYLPVEAVNTEVLPMGNPHRIAVSERRCEANIITTNRNSHKSWI